MDQKPNKPPQPKGSLIGVGIALGAGVGAALGVAFHNIAVGVALGAGLGVALGAILESQNNKKKE